MNLMKWFKVDKTDDNPLLYHRMNEAFKWAYAHRLEPSIFHPISTRIKIYHFKYLFYRSKLGDPSDPEYAAEIEKVRKLRSV